VFPWGPLRERLAAGLARASAFVLMGEGEAPASLQAAGKPVLRARIAPVSDAPAGPLIAFAGIARPEKFFDTLSAMGAALEETLPYPDHHAFGAGEIRWLQTLARERGAALVTTEKDWVRLPADAREKIAVLKIAARFEDEAALDALLAPYAA
jgi:tetraacyldisaccharide 4'-kinase